ncbi:hypothetical protein FISHEDRAFT_55178 [Fistulina hepatica ATCC 64428]|uniref:Uncharacterized protein n=1 Tax=Fistulina hepatica ATCC 64428 TaxID=1128425 RepID=A0A0D7APE0_9AGAR|nr:hypothetical protein FISHEDRAFT_55178 [Fistulina hepatica ATCC 64428]
MSTHKHEDGVERHVVKEYQFVNTDANGVCIKQRANASIYCHTQFSKMNEQAGPRQSQLSTRAGAVSRRMDETELPFGTVTEKERVMDRHMKLSSERGCDPVASVKATTRKYKGKKNRVAKNKAEGAGVVGQGKRSASNKRTRSSVKVGKTTLVGLKIPVHASASHKSYQRPGLIQGPHVDHACPVYMSAEKCLPGAAPVTERYYTGGQESAGFAEMQGRCLEQQGLFQQQLHYIPSSGVTPQLPSPFVTPPPKELVQVNAQVMPLIVSSVQSISPTPCDVSVLAGGPADANVSSVNPRSGMQYTAPGLTQLTEPPFTQHADPTSVLLRQPPSVQFAAPTPIQIVSPASIHGAHSAQAPLSDFEREICQLLNEGVASSSWDAGAAAYAAGGWAFDSVQVSYPMNAQAVSSTSMATPAPDMTVAPSDLVADPMQLTVYPMRQPSSAMQRPSTNLGQVYPSNMSANSAHVQAATYRTPAQITYPTPAQTPSPSSAQTIPNQSAYLPAAHPGGYPIIRPAVTSQNPSAFKLAVDHAAHPSLGWASDVSSSTLQPSPPFVQNCGRMVDGEVVAGATNPIAPINTGISPNFTMCTAGVLVNSVFLAGSASGHATIANDPKGFLDWATFGGGKPCLKFA